MFNDNQSIISAEHFEDCISRAEARHLIVETDRIGGMSCGAFKTLYNGIDNLPSVTPQVKTGHWIKIKPYPLQMHDYECSECGHETDDNTENYCSECGAKMDSERSNQ